jgi:hypothetical protein
VGTVLPDSGRGERISFSRVWQGFFVWCLIVFFSSLDRRKEAKEDQGIRDAGQVFLVLQDLRDVG